jgi:CRP-like cAMP-binding protein
MSRTQVSPDHAVLVRQLSTIADLTEEQIHALACLPLRVKRFAQDHDIVRQGDHPNESCLILEGFVCRYKIVADGRRQILSFHFPGDLPDLQSLHLQTMDHSLGALTPCRVAFVPHDAIRALGRAHPPMADVLTKHMLIDASIFRDWIANIGRRSAYQRIAHIFCEMFVRMRVLGLLNETSFELPVTQTDLGDATGLSTVHVNRTLQELRREGLIATKGRTYYVANWERLQQAGDFDPAYLHLRIETP